MSSAEGGEKVVKGNFVGHIDGRQAQAPLVTVTTEEIVFAHRYVEQIARRNARWIVVIVLCPGRRNRYVFGTIASRGAEIRAKR